MTKYDGIGVSGQELEGLANMGTKGRCEWIENLLARQRRGPGSAHHAAELEGMADTIKNMMDSNESLNAENAQLFEENARLLAQIEELEATQKHDDAPPPSEPVADPTPAPPPVAGLPPIGESGVAAADTGNENPAPAPPVPGDN